MMRHQCWYRCLNNMQNLHPIGLCNRNQKILLNDQRSMQLSRRRQSCQSTKYLVRYSWRSHQDLLQCSPQQLLHFDKAAQFAIERRFPFGNIDRK